MRLTKMFSIATMFAIVLISGCKKDPITSVIPTVTSTDPSDNATNIAINSKVSVTFNVDMDSSTITTSNVSILHETTVVPGTIVYNGKTATFTPTGNLTPGILYTVTVSPNVKNKSGQNLAKEYVTSFTTGDILDVVVPEVTSTNPVNMATGIGLDQSVSVTFSKPMDQTTITSMTFTLKQGANVISGVVSYAGSLATFTPASKLAANTIYSATITTGTKDMTGHELATNVDWSFTTIATTSGLAVVNLRAAGNYVILAKTTVTNISTSAILGDLGLSPAATSYITGFALTKATGYATSQQITGKIYAADMAAPTGINLTTAVENMLTAYTDAAGRPTPKFTELGTGNIGGKTLAPGLYKWTNTVTIPTDVTIAGNANDVWIFQIAGNLTMSSAVKINLTGGALARNIFWQVAGQATLGTTSHFEGIILSKTGITFQTGASINGRALAQTAVILDSNTVAKPE